MNRVVNFVAVGLVVVVTAAAASLYQHGAREWEERAQRVEEFAARETARADTAEAEARAAERAAAWLASRADEQVTIVRTRVDEVREVAVPDTCISFVAPRDTLIDEALAAAETARQAYLAEQEAMRKLGLAYGIVRAANDSLSSVLADRPKPRAWYLPKLGVTAGIGAKGFDVVAGLTWEISF